MSPGLVIKPSAIALVQMDNDFAIDYSIKAYIQDKAWVGLSYRDIQTGVFMFGYSINNVLGASYSYEMSFTKFQQFNSGSHELVLSVRLNNFRRQGAFLW